MELRGINSFLDRVEVALDQIVQNPEFYPIHHPTDRVHRCVIHKRIVLYYRLNNKQIDLLTFWNTYQNPDEIKR